MKKETCIALKAAFCTYNPSNFQDFHRFLPNDVVETLETIPEEVNLKSYFSKNQWINRIHYSWFMPFFESLADEYKPLFLSLFAQDQKKELKSLLHVEKEKKPVFPQFLLSILHDKIYPKEILPKELLFKNEMSSLLNLSKKELVLLVDLLSMYDLAHEMRQIVDKTLLHKVYEILSKEELSFLNIAVKQSVKWVPPKLNLSGWDGDAKKLTNLLHYRGLFRLSMATFSEEKNFQWHLCHLFDIGRGKVLLKFYAGNCDREMIPYFRAQTLDIIKRFEK